jgi:hypothetical protein
VRQASPAFGLPWNQIGVVGALNCGSVGSPAVTEELGTIRSNGTLHILWRWPKDHDAGLL